MGYSMKMGSKEMHSPMNFKNDDAKLLSLSKGLFGVDTTVETEQKKHAKRKQAYLKDKSKYMSALFKDTAPKYFVDYNFKIGNKKEHEVLTKKSLDYASISLYILDQI